MRCRLAVDARACLPPRGRGYGPDSGYTRGGGLDLGGRAESVGSRGGATIEHPLAVGYSRRLTRSSHHRSIQPSYCRAYTASTGERKVPRWLLDTFHVRVLEWNQERRRNAGFQQNKSLRVQGNRLVRRVSRSSLAPREARFGGSPPFCRGRRRDPGSYPRCARMSCKVSELGRSSAAAAVRRCEWLGPARRSRARPPAASEW